MKSITILFTTLLGAIAIVVASAYLFLHLSLPDLDDSIASKGVRSITNISRDALGTAIITADD